jgi:hypothetical protein
MISFRDADGLVLLAALEHYRVESHKERMKCGPGADVLRGNFVQQEDDAARLMGEVREQL